MARAYISIPFSDICNSSFEEGIFPVKNKIVKVIPSHKNSSTKDVNNYRPISLSTFSKIMENLVAIRLITYLDLHNIIYPAQSGFRSGFSTTHSHISILKPSKSMDVGCIDLKKLLLEYYGINDKALTWFKPYLTDRKRFVSLNGVESNMNIISCGVPQGSVLGHLLFLHINDLPNISKHLKFFLFADDTNIYYVFNDLKNLENKKNKELNYFSCYYKLLYSQVGTQKEYSLSNLP